MQIDLTQAILALTDTLDLVGVDEVAHGKRVGYMAFKCSELMDLNKQERERLFHMGLLHDCGVSSTREHSNLVTELQWKHAEQHAIVGEKLLNSFSPFSSFAPVIRYHHTAWSELKNLPGLSNKLRREANLIFLVDRVDALSASYYGHNLMDKIPLIRKEVAQLSGNLFDPALVDLFLTVSSSDAFWMVLESPHLEHFLRDMERHTDPRPSERNEVKQLARLYAHIVDAKSTFTYAHSLGVAQLSSYLAKLLNLGSDVIYKLEIAGLLHDLGKLRIPDEILDKPGELNIGEEHTMRRHSFETYQILRRIDGFSEIAQWAAYHHEKPNGKGYPFCRGGEALSIEARIIAVADVFQALAQNRPYREALPLPQIIEILQTMAREKNLDEPIVKLVSEHADECLQQATICPQEKL